MHYFIEQGTRGDTDKHIAHYAPLMSVPIAATRLLPRPLAQWFRTAWLEKLVASLARGK